MNKYSIKKRFNNPLKSGLASFLVLFVFASLTWPLWSVIAKSFFLMIAGEGLKSLDGHLVDHFLKDAVEGTFFWMSIVAWCWATLVFGGYGKYKHTNRQPHAGIRQYISAVAGGIIGFIVLTGILGIWWKPFGWDILFTPATVEEVELAIKGWGCSNFYALMVIICQIPITSLFHRHPFADKIEEPGVGIGAMAIGTSVALIIWFAMVVPSLFELSFNGQVITGKPMGSWTTVVAWCQCFILWFLIPAEGGELFPMKLVCKKQPFMGMAGLIISFMGGHLTLRVMRAILASFAENLDMPVDLVVASFILSIIVAMLLWHHHFYDYPSDKVVANTLARTCLRILVWIVLGSIFGVVWLKTYMYLPFGGNNLGLGYPMLGVLAGQFVFLMPLLYMNTFFDRWPVCYTELILEDIDDKLLK
jgi:AAT family amino acid transporter